MLVDEVSYDFVPTMAQSEAWKKLTEMPFDCTMLHHYDFDAMSRIESIDLVQAVRRFHSLPMRMHAKPGVGDAAV